MRGPFWFGVTGEPERGPVPLDYRGPGYHENPCIFDVDGKAVVGCGEYYIFASPTAVKLLLDALNETRS